MSKTNHKKHEKRIQAAQMVKFIAAGQTIEEAGKELGYGKTSALALAGSEEVAFLVKKFEEEMIALTTRRVSSSLNEAYSTIEEIMRSSTSDSTRLKAAEKIIEISWRVADRAQKSDDPVSSLPTPELLQGFLNKLAATLGADAILRFAAELKSQPSDKLPEE